MDHRVPVALLNPCQVGASATHESKVPDEFFRTGVYRPRKGEEMRRTFSRPMDISKASNFERYIAQRCDAV